MGRKGRALVAYLEETCFVPANHQRKKLINVRALAQIMCFPIGTVDSLVCTRRYFQLREGNGTEEQRGLNVSLPLP